MMSKFTSILNTITQQNNATDAWSQIHHMLLYIIHQYGLNSILPHPCLFFYGLYLEFFTISAYKAIFI